MRIAKQSEWLEGVKENPRGENADMWRHRHEQTERNDTIFYQKLYSEDSRFVSLQFEEAKL